MPTRRDPKRGRDLPAGDPLDLGGEVDARHSLTFEPAPDHRSTNADLWIAVPVLPDELFSKPRFRMAVIVQPLLEPLPGGEVIAHAVTE